MAADSSISSDLAVRTTSEFTPSLQTWSEESAASLYSLTLTSSALKPDPPWFETTIIPNDSTTTTWTDAANLSWKIGSPIILTVGTIGNTMSILVLRRMAAEASTFLLLLTALAVADLGLLYVGLLPYWVSLQFGFSLLNYSEAFCKLLTWFCYSLGLMSAWFLVAITVHRVVVVIWPHRARATCTRIRIHVTITTLTFVCFTATSPLVYGITLSTDKTVCTFSPDFMDNFLHIWVWYDFLLASGIPLFLIVVSNVILTWTASRSVRRARKMLTANQGQGQQAAAREKKISSMTLTLIVVSAFFAVLTAPICVVFLIQLYWGEAVLTDHLLFAQSIANQLWYINSSINFFLYILTGSRFRAEMKRLFGKESWSSSSSH
ncbi:hypothetical protein BaRGS_00029963 [Batillaria attramentaria]|uniref:G-protein coupled receptors family 1 profile domain-containing protein n=1 Tax=Batillaria attramentaria TaxID=370345 RepID=A0ABD0JUW3_9CAEN